MMKKFWYQPCTLHPSQSTNQFDSLIIDFDKRLKKLSKLNPDLALLLRYFNSGWNSWWVPNGINIESKILFYDSEQVISEPTSFLWFWKTLESIQYTSTLAFAGIIRKIPKAKLHRELSLEPLSFRCWFQRLE